MLFFFGEVAFEDPYGVLNTLPGFAVLDAAARRTFDSFHHAAEENAFSRLYGGVHNRFAAENGMEQGKCVARGVLKELDSVVQSKSP